jgi:antitoxin (DNA-binding transcriptional repressor) of toxin-antitoxin stability system
VQFAEGVAMKIPISEARRKLPALVKTVRKDPRATIQITVRDEVVAELRAAQPVPEPGQGAQKLLQLRKKLIRRALKARGRDVSVRVKEYLYGPKGAIR